MEYLTFAELNELESVIEDMFPGGIDETDLNDLFWFDEDTIAEWLGYRSFDEIRERDEER